jgi:hypothetical protein
VTRGLAIAIENTSHAALRAAGCGTHKKTLNKFAISYVRLHGQQKLATNVDGKIDDG